LDWLGPPLLIAIGMGGPIGINTQWDWLGPQGLLAALDWLGPPLLIAIKLALPHGINMKWYLPKKIIGSLRIGISNWNKLAYLNY
jgi:hypothetical protein